MESYTIDPSVFAPPVIGSNRTAFVKYSKNIEKCYSFLQRKDISVYVFDFNNSFDLGYILAAGKSSGYPVDFLKQVRSKIENIIKFDSILECQYENEEIAKKIREWIFSNNYSFKTRIRKFYFERWFNLRIVNAGKSIFPNGNNAFIERLNKLGILNKLIYLNYEKHYIILNDQIESIYLQTPDLEYKIEKKDLKTNNYFEPLLQTDIPVLDVNNIPDNLPVIKFKTVLEVYNYASIIFKDFIIFGNDVKKGIETIKETAGPPDRIYSYLETLKTYCLIKRNNKNIISDVYLLEALGCVFSDEKIEDMLFKKDFMENRKFDNGSNQKTPFSLHLKPSTFDPLNDTSLRKRNVRIYICWDKNEQKVIVGYIGEHKYTGD